MPRSPTTISGERPTQSATRTSGPTPRPRRWWASWLARASSVAVSQRPVAAGHGDRLGRPIRLRLEELVEGDLLGPLRRRIPIDQQVAPLGLAQQRESREPSIGGGGDGFEQGLQAPEHPVDRGGVEQVGAVLERRHQALRRTPSRRGSGRTSPCRSRPPAGSAPARAAAPAEAGRSGGRTSPGRAATGPSSRSGCKTSTSCSNGTSWCAYASSATRRTRRATRGSWGRPRGRRGGPGC